jgi:uncharacterized membrane protein YfcA
MNQHNKKWLTLRPIGWVGSIVAFFGIFIEKFIDIESTRLKWAGPLLLIIGLYLMFKGQDEHPP